MDAFAKQRNIPLAAGVNGKSMNIYAGLLRMVGRKNMKLQKRSNKR
jgi:hypothetical protein